MTRQASPVAADGQRVAVPGSSILVFIHPELFTAKEECVKYSRTPGCGNHIEYFVETASAGTYQNEMKNACEAAVTKYVESVRWTDRRYSLRQPYRSSISRNGP